MDVVLGNHPTNGVALDKIDARILTELQADAARPVSEIAARVGLSTNPCWRRIKRLQDEGILKQRVALVDPASMGLGITVFVSVRTNQHNKEWFEAFSAGVREMSEVVEFHRMSGEIDYLLKILVADLAEFDAVYKRLIEVVPLFDVSSSFSLEQIKYTTAVPIRGAD